MAQPRRSPQKSAEIVRSEEQLHVDVVARPYERVRLSKRIVTYTETRTVEVRREELVVVREPMTEDDRPADPEGKLADLEFMLLHEEVVTSIKVVPYERVRVSVGRTCKDRVVQAQLRKERVDG